MEPIALVTGGTRGIGAKISRGIAGSRAPRCTATYASNDNAAEAISRENGVKVCRFDVSSFDECESGMQKIIGWRTGR